MPRKPMASLRGNVDATHAKALESQNASNDERRCVSSPLDVSLGAFASCAKPMRRSRAPSICPENLRAGEPILFYVFDLVGVCHV